MIQFPSMPRAIAPGRRIRRWLNVGARSVTTLAFVLVLLQTSDLLPPDMFQQQLSKLTEGKIFDFISWELGALARKLAMEISAPQDTLTETQRRQLVIEYLDGFRKVDQLRQEINATYSRLGHEQAHLQAASQEQELDLLRSWLQERQDLVEGILEEQVSAVLQAEGLGRWGYIWPPLKSRFTDLPLLLVISARSEITREANVDLEPGMSVSEREVLETEIDGTFDTKRSFVTPIGGLSAYPAMILEINSLVWLADTFAHEWTHHFLIFYPLGYKYSASGELTSINETTASIVGREIGRQMILTYYPELEDRVAPLPAPPKSPPMSSGELVWPDEPPPDTFSFNREMRRTRLRVDELLAEGRIEEAEAYMEERRHFFVSQGYDLRKLNQAYFAFYGSYATSPSSANPIGGQLEWLRAQYPSLRDFLVDVAKVGHHEELLALLVKKGTPAEQ